jgi:hypothetical protein
MDQEPKEPIPIVPLQFDVPSPECAANIADVELLTVGDYVKLYVAEEMLWAKVTSASKRKNEVTGKVDRTSDYVELNGLKMNDEVSFEKKHIFKVFKK